MATPAWGWCGRPGRDSNRPTSAPADAPQGPARSGSTPATGRPALRPGRGRPTAGPAPPLPPPTLAAAKRPTGAHSPIRLDVQIPSGRRGQVRRLQDRSARACAGPYPPSGAPTQRVGYAPDGPARSNSCGPHPGNAGCRFGVDDQVRGRQPAVKPGGGPASLRRPQSGAGSARAPPAPGFEPSARRPGYRPLRPA